jgi:protocatechuate 3,4-dioxygenase beta subunit
LAVGKLESAGAQLLQSRLSITGISGGLQKTVTVTVYDEVPRMAFFQVHYLNQSDEPLRVTGWTNNRYVIDAAGSDEPAFWSYQSGSYRNRPDWIMPLKVNFKQENFLGMNATDYGGGTPVAGAVLEVWQANAVGRYAHIGDKNPAPLDPNFQGYARIVTDAEGRYSIKTIKPGAYPTPSGWMRAPHIHFDITGKVTRLVTAMYFEGEPLNDQDRILKTSFNPKSQMTQVDRADASSEPGTLKANWDIVLITG